MNMSEIKGITVALLGIIVALYVSIWTLFIGGVLQVLSLDFWGLPRMLLSVPVFLLLGITSFNLGNKICQKPRLKY